MDEAQRGRERERESPSLEGVRDRKDDMHGRGQWGREEDRGEKNWSWFGIGHQS